MFAAWALVAAFDPALVKPGNKAWGYVSVMDTLASTLRMPVMVINGAASGPTFVVTVTYPTEYCAVEAAGRIYQLIDAAQLTGKLVVLPAINMQVLQFRSPMFALTQSITPSDGKMLAASFPGNPNGTTTEVLAAYAFRHFISQASFHVDLRGGDLPESHLTHTIFLQGVGGPAMDAKLRAMGTKFGTQYCRESNHTIFDTKPGSLIYEATAIGVPSIISEAGRGFDPQPTEEDVLSHVTGVTNLLRWAKMLDGPLSPSSTSQYYLGAALISVPAPAAGIFKRGPDRGALVKRGERIGVVADLDGTVLATVVAPCDAVVHEMMPRRVVTNADTVYHLATITGPVVAPARPCSYQDIAGSCVGFSLPASVDWRSHGVVDPVQDQGQLGSPALIVAAHAVSSLHKITTKLSTSLSFQELLDCCPVSQPGAGSFVSPADIFRCVINTTHGLCTEADYPRSKAREPCHSSSCEAAFKLKGLEMLPAGNQTALEAAVATRPVATGVNAGSTAFELYTGGIISSGCEGAIDHYVLIVGYGTDAGTGVDYWIAQNTWGTSWGEAGYVRIKRGPEDVCGLSKLAVAPVA